jgi:hypothetical protein
MVERRRFLVGVVSIQGEEMVWRKREPMVALVILAVSASLFLWIMDGPRADAQDRSMQAMELAKEVSLDKHAYLKRLSLDLTGYPPSWEEYEALEGSSDVPLETIDEMLDSETFLDSMVRYHRDLLWANVTNIQYIQFPWDLTRTVVGPNNDRHTVHYMNRRSVYYRGGPEDTENDRIPCGHWEATRDVEGNYEVECDEATGRCMEGWVWVEPYFAPGTELKVCAFDAQEAEFSAGGDIDCGTMRSRQETTCGCGAGLRYCDFNRDGVNVQTEVGRSLGEQTLQIVRWVIGSDKPYHEVLTTRRSFINGPLVHYFKHQMPLASNIDLDPAPVEAEFLPQMSWDETDTWVPILHGEEQSGILTSYGFLLRFQTNRGRVNRFYNAFLDRFFDASKGSDSPNCEPASADLTKMCGCQKCHIAVEPWAAYWGRWKQQGGGFLSPNQFPVYDEVCESCARAGVGSCPLYCRNEYVVETVPEDRVPYLGYLRGYEFLGEENQINVEGGPRLWVERSIQDGSLANGLVSQMWKQYMRRPLTGSKADTEIRDDLVRKVMQSDYDLKFLIKSIVTHSAYRRIK